MTSLATASFCHKNHSFINKDSCHCKHNCLVCTVEPDLSEADKFLFSLTNALQRQKMHQTDQIEEVAVEVPARSPARPTQHFKMVPNSPDTKLLETSSIDYNAFSDRSSRASVFSSDHEQVLHDDLSDDDELEISQVLDFYAYYDVTDEKNVHQIDSVVEYVYDSNKTCLPLKLINTD